MRNISDFAPLRYCIKVALLPPRTVLGGVAEYVSGYNVYAKCTVIAFCVRTDYVLYYKLRFLNVHYYFNPL